MIKRYNAAYAVLGTLILLALAGCNLPGSSDDDEDDGDDPYVPGYTYVNGNAVHESGQTWEIKIDYQSDSDIHDVGVYVKRADTELRHITARVDNSNSRYEGTATVNFTWQQGEEGCRVVPFVSNTSGVTEGYELYMPYGVVINSLSIEQAGDTFDFSLLVSLYSDADIRESELLIYDESNNVVNTMTPPIYNNGGDNKIETMLYDHSFKPNTNYRAMLKLATEYNSTEAECNFTTPRRSPNQDDNNPPEV